MGDRWDERGRHLREGETERGGRWARELPVMWRLLLFVVVSCFTQLFLFNFCTPTA